MYSAGQSTVSTTIDVEPTSWVQVPQQPTANNSDDNKTEDAEKGTTEAVEAEKPVGPKPAKVVDAQAINLSAFLHFAPKSASENNKNEEKS